MASHRFYPLHYAWSPTTFRVLQKQIERFDAGFLLVGGKRESRAMRAPVVRRKQSSLQIDSSSNFANRRPNRQLRLRISLLGGSWGKLNRRGMAVSTVLVVGFRV